MLPMPKPARVVSLLCDRFNTVTWLKDARLHMLPLVRPRWARFRGVRVCKGCPWGAYVVCVGGGGRVSA